MTMRKEVGDGGKKQPKNVGCLCINPDFHLALFSLSVRFFKIISFRVGQFGLIHSAMFFRRNLIFLSILKWLFFVEFRILT